MKAEVLSPFGLLGRGIRGTRVALSRERPPQPASPFSESRTAARSGCQRGAPGHFLWTQHRTESSPFRVSWARGWLLLQGSREFPPDHFLGQQSLYPPNPCRPHTHTPPVMVAGWAGLMKEHPCVCMRMGDGPGRERVSHPSISLWRILAEEERWGLSPSKATIGWVIPTSECSKYQREEGGQASGCSSGPHGPIWGCLDARHYVPAGSSRQQPG